MNFNVEDAEVIREVEQEAWLDMFAAAPTASADLLEMKAARSVAFGLLACRRIRAVAFNRAFAVGQQWALNPADADRGVEWLRLHAAPNWVVQIDPDGLRGASVEVSQHGLRETGQAWAKLMCSPANVVVADAAYETVKTVINEVDASVFASIVCDGFGFPDEAFPWFRSLALRHGWRAYLSLERGQPVAAGAVFSKGDRAWLGIDATLPAHRGRGHQAALIGQRLRDCVSSGTRHAVAETGRPAVIYDPDDGSYRNYMRAGFRLSHFSVNFGRPAD